MRFFLNISYNGRRFHGWQIQPNDLSVQQSIEDALSKILRTRTPIVGAGRTDAGVNARMMTAHFDSDSLADILSEEKRKGIVLHSLNSLLGPDVAIHDIVPVHDDAHARFDATSRTYRYFVHERKNPFVSEFSLLTSPLDYDLMNLAAQQLLSVSDFTSFAKLHSDAKTNICRVTEVRWEPLGEDRYMFIITADRFLRNMVRAVVGTLIEVGRGKMSLEGFNEVVGARNRCSAGTSMPPHPLFLWSITYPYIEF